MDDELETMECSMAGLQRERGGFPTRRILLGVAAAAGVAAAGFFAIGPRRFWRFVAGPADQGPVDFATFSRRSVPNDALASSKGASTQPVDLILPTYRTSPIALMGALDDAARSSGRAERVDDGTEPAYRRYVFRSRVFEFPDTLDARAVGRPDGETSLILYSRSQLGRGDFGSNRARLEAIVRALGRSPGVEAVSTRR
ncbi:DUF1499 domain-containing protein [Jiella pacifica]|uniref:DUF1499 domain-containing protein n=1 Tax=Jiella pacifica TaxID=2696469 RepID=A0A6N9T1C5_9HYPH|nr:DUF1499 domain-containing protein [Jiella pacifica]NDW05117.1 DUF1499 domain-containing protein [Jiella pacifica]